MFTIEFLHRIRDHEIGRIAAHLAPGARILELGGGTGHQAQRLSALGYPVVSLDLATSNYRDARVFPVQEYDGKTLPFAAGSFDVVFSSSVLEHVADAARFHREARRVLAPGGHCIHVMPSATWRLWTTLAHYVDVAQRAGSALPSVRRALGALWGGRVPPRHGESGNVWSELSSFSRRRWRAHFAAHGFEVLSAEPVGLFYSGSMILGARWPIESRERAARWLGSATVLYRVQPRGSA